jgi:hypothetical protein
MRTFIENSERIYMRNKTKLKKYKKKCIKLPLMQKTIKPPKLYWS